MNFTFLVEVAKILDFQVVNDVHGRYFLFKGNEFKNGTFNQEHALGPQIWITERDNRIRCTGYSPYNKKVTITVSWDSSPERVAKQIQQRLLPTYIPLWEENTKKFNQEQDNENAAKTLVAELIEELDGRLSHHNPLEIYGSGCSYSVVPSDKPYVNIKYLPSLPKAEAIQVLKIIKEFWEKNN